MPWSSRSWRRSHEAPSGSLALGPPAPRKQCTRLPPTQNPASPGAYLQTAADDMATVWPAFQKAVAWRSKSAKVGGMLE